MNHYPHHIGDFNNATRHLTRVERSLYRDLMDLYYDTEQPLPGDDFDKLARRVLAFDEAEKQSLRTVLDEFFHLMDGVYRHARCDAEIEKYQGLRESASRAGKASAERRANLKATPVKRPLAKRSTNQNQNQNQVEEAKASSGVVPEWVPADQWRDFEQMRKAMRSVPFTDAARKGVIADLDKLRTAGHDPADLLQTAVTNGWRTVYPPKPQHTPTAGKHAGFASKNYREGVAPDGSFT